ncbi:allophycocyanin linker domain protein [Leptolyngbya sp. Heron Island J]|uniref:phycobilisome linker polypeptide n=1 Tax=Leptolyngbya sp. Heron Island J TaxID=1385935 RepID=UPI0003B9A412|nr:phycobilisome linker polypeptide [Leptolyngbya sp. Heron Island J]ESA32512.1 allophycocyanin linker domain protein [Leptolyngbya sp. Heron Island J]
MLGQYATSTASSLDNRMFVYELTGLSENEVTVSHCSPIRTSHTQLIQVPFHRMGEEMRRITLLGGKIVDIRLLGSPQATSSADTSPED